MKHRLFNKLTTVLAGTSLILMSLIAGFATTSVHAEDIKIGFLVKQPEEGWFQDEWKYAEEAGRAKGFKIIKIGVRSGDKVITAIDNLKAQRAQGFVICTPDTQLGPSIVAKAKANNLKLLTVDDRLVGSDGKPLENVHHVGISAYKIGEQVGQALLAEMKKRGWNMADVGALNISYDQLATIKEREDGATAVLTKAGFPAANIFNSPMAKQEVEAGVNAANVTLTKNPKFKHWIIFGGNDAAVFGGVRASEGRNLKTENVIGVGINGGEDVVSEFKRPETTAFFASILLSAKAHGYDTSVMMYDWIKNGKEPAKITYTSGKVMTRDNYKELKGL